MPKPKDACIPGPTTVCPIEVPVCTPRQQLVCTVVNGQQFCQCLTDAPPPPASCTVAMVFPSGNPQGVYIGKLENGCDQASLEIALAVLLARVMTGPPLP